MPFYLAQPCVLSTLPVCVQFDKEEGMTLSPKRKQLYFATARIAKAMIAGPNKYNYAASQDLNLPENKCGAVWAMDLDGSWTGNKAKVQGPGH